MKIYVPFVLCTLIGALLFFLSSQYPRYTDQEMVDAAMTELRDQFHSGKLNSNEASKVFYEIQDRYQTPHIFLSDLGVGLASFGISSIGLLGLLRVGTFGHIAALQTLPTKESLQILGNMTLFLFPFAQGIHLTRLAKRGDFPGWADSIGIPIGYTIISCIVLAPILNLIWWMCIRRAKLPASLWIWSPSAPLWSWCWTGAAGLMTLFICLFLTGSILEGDWLTIPLAMGAFYVTLGMRAAIISAETPEASIETEHPQSDLSRS